MESSVGDMALSEMSLVSEQSSSPARIHKTPKHAPVPSVRVIELAVALQSSGFIAVSYLELKEGARRGESDRCIARLQGGRGAKRCQYCHSKMPGQSVGLFTIKIPRHFLPNDTVTRPKK